MNFKKSVLITLAVFLSHTIGGQTNNCIHGQCENWKPRASIITSVYKGDEFIRKFLEDITAINNFSSYELILINANSPGNEEPVIKEYVAKFPNIVYERLKQDPGVYGVWNYAIKKARANFVTNSNLDDRRNPESLEKHIEFLETNPEVDLVYSSYFITHTPNETFENNTYRYSVEASEFVPNKMYLCLPGPQPTWRKSMHDKCGYFREDMKHSGDIELWNRAVLKGSRFSHIPGYSTLFYMNPEGLSTSTNAHYAARRHQEDLFVRGAYGAAWNSAPEAPRILIKMPTRSRPEQFFSQLDNYYRKLSGNVQYHFLITCDEDDTSMNNNAVKDRLAWYPNLTYSFTKNSSKVEAYNRDLELFKNYDILLAVGDDMEPVAWGYDKTIATTMQQHFPDFDGILNFHDGHVGSEVMTYPIVGNKFYNRLGYLFHPSYKSLFANEELTVVARILGKEAIYNDILIKHNHPVFGLAKWDELYVRNEGLKNHDERIFNSRRSKNFAINEEESFEKDWSILICTLNERENTFKLLFDNLQQQIASAGLKDYIEVLSFKDNRTHSIGHKRNDLIRRSKGKYISFIDDDDLVSNDYITKIHSLLETNPDCVNLLGIMTTQGKYPQKFIHSIKYKEKTLESDGTYHSPPNHLNPIRRAIAAQFLFPEKNFREDADWSVKIAQSGLLKKEASIDTPYYFYRYDGKYHTGKIESSALPHYYCTAADEKYFPYVLHLIASIHTTNFSNLGEIAVADIGLNEEQIKQLNSIKKVRVFEVEKANPDIIKPFQVNANGKIVPGWYSWKPIAVKQTLQMYPYVLWIDASSLVLKPLDDLFKHIQQNGYFLSTIGNEIINGKYRHPMSWCTTKRVIDAFNLSKLEHQWIMDAEQIMTTTFGISQEKMELFMPFFNTSKDITLFIDDGSTPTGLGSGRHDQTLMSVFAYTKNLVVHKQDYTQHRPMSLIVDAKEIPLYITWHRAYVTDKTAIYSARGDSENYSHLVKNIHYKALEGQQ